MQCFFHGGEADPIITLNNEFIILKVNEYNNKGNVNYGKDAKARPGPASSKRNFFSLASSGNTNNPEFDNDSPSRKSSVTKKQRLIVDETDEEAVQKIDDLGPLDYFFFSMTTLNCPLRRRVAIQSAQNRSIRNQVNAPAIIVHLNASTYYRYSFSF